VKKSTLFVLLLFHKYSFGDQLQKLQQSAPPVQQGKTQRLCKVLNSVINQSEFEEPRKTLSRESFLNGDTFEVQKKNSRNATLSSVSGFFLQ